MIDNLFQNDTVYFYHQLSDFPTGNAYNASSGPSYRVYQNNNATPILTGTMTQLDSADVTGLYVGSIQLTSANGFAVGNTYAISTGATVDGVTARGLASVFIVRDPLLSSAINISETVTTYVWNQPDFGDAAGYASTVLQQIAQIWRAVSNKRVVNGAIDTIMRDDNVTPMLSGGQSMGPTTRGKMWNNGNPGGG